MALDEQSVKALLTKCVNFLDINTAYCIFMAALMMETVRFSETLTSTDSSGRRQNPKERHFQQSA